MELLLSTLLRRAPGNLGSRASLNDADATFLLDKYTAPLAALRASPCTMAILVQLHRCIQALIFLMTTENQRFTKKAALKDGLCDPYR